MTRPSVKEVLGILRQSFKAIDLRAVIVALGDNQGWQNAFTVIRFSAKTQKEISAEHESLKQLYELPSEVFNKRLGMEHNIEPYIGINIELSTYPVEQFEILVRKLGEGLITAGSRTFRVFDHDFAIDLMSQQMDLWQNLDYKEIGDNWPVYYWGVGEQRAYFVGSKSGQGERLQLKEHDLDKQSGNFGFENFPKLVECITEQPFGRGSRHAFEIFLPVYARIKSVIPSTDTVEVSGHFHHSLGELTLECFLYEPTKSDRSVDRPLGKNRVIPPTNGQDLTSFSYKFPLKYPSESGIVRMSLFKQAETRINLHDERSPLKSGIMAFKAFACFVPEEDITEYLENLKLGKEKDLTNCHLFRSFVPKDGSKKKDELIEYVVTYLLSLCQLNPLLLSNPKYDVINGGLQAGSADIVASAADGRAPILISCTMGMPDLKKRDMLLAARTVVANRLNVPVDTIRAVLVTGKPSVSSSYKELRELAATDLEGLWEMCRKGNLSDARRLLGL